MEPNITPPQQNISQQPVFSSTLPPITPQKRSHILLWSIIVILVIVIASAGYYFFLQKTNNNSMVKGSITSLTGVGDISPINDSDLRVPVDQSAIDCSVVNNLAATTSNELTSYVTSTSTAKASAAVQNIIKKYSAQIKTYIQGGVWTETVTTADNNDILCSLLSIRNVANIALANVKYLAENKKSTEAQTIILGVLNTTQQIEDHSGSLIGYLVTVSIKENSINLLLSLKTRGLIDEVSFRSLLSKYFDNKIGQKRALQYEYSRTAQSIDDIVAGRYNSPILTSDGSGSNVITMIQKEKTSYNYEPNNSKLLYYSMYKSEYANVDLPCGSTYNTPIPKFDLKDSSVENYIGKTIFSITATSFNSLNDKRCALESKFSQF